VVELDPRLLERPGGAAIARAQDPEDDVLRAELRRPQRPRLRLRVLEREPNLRSGPWSVRLLAAAAEVAEPAVHGLPRDPHGPRNGSEGAARAQRARDLLALELVELVAQLSDRVERGLG